MKRVCSALLSAALCLSLLSPAFAAENQIAPFDAPTQEEYAEAKAYLDAVREHLNVVRALVMGGTPKTEEEFYAKVREAQASIKAVWTMSAPAFKGMEQAVKRLRSRAEVVLWENIDPYLPLEENSGASPTESGPKRMITWEPAKSSDGITVYRPNIEKAPDFNLDKFWSSFVEGIIPLKGKSSSGYTYFLDLEKECAESKNFLTQLAPALAAKEAKPRPITPDPAEFADAKDIQYWDAVATLTKLGVVSGKDDGSFEPAGNVTRAEAAKMIAVLMNGGSEPSVEAKEAPTFSDIQGHWAEPYIEYCADMHIVSGWDGRFDPDGNVTVVELYKMALTALGHDAEAYHLMGASWAAQTIERATKVNSHNGVRLSDGLVNAEEMDVYQPASREVAAQILYNALLANPIVVAPDSQTPDGTVVWKYSAKEDDTLLHQRFALGEMPTVPAQPTV